jgi:epidermal growth factor receptor substrate 15
LQTQLFSAKAAYETETLLLATLRERLTVQTADIKLTREQLITAESDSSAVRVEKGEVGGALLRDKDEARELQRKIVEVGAQVESLKADVEKIKKEAKHQKGLLAIARKQLSTKEAERAKLARELELASQELASVVREKEEAETELSKELPPSANHDFAGTGGSAASVVATRVVAGTPGTGSPARAATPAGPKSNNPFELLARSASSSPAPVPAPSSPFMTLGDAFRPASPDPAKDAVGSPVTKPATQEERFGFFHAFEADKAPSTTKASSTTAAEIETALAKSRAIEDSPEPAATLPWHEEPSRDDASEDHSAPEPSAINGPQLTRSATINAAFNKYPDLDSVDAQFPSLENQVDAGRHTESESQGPLREIEPTDSDTDSDSDDDVPLAEAQAAIKGQAAASLQAASLAPTIETSRPEKTFDEIFVAPPEAATPKPQALTPKSPAPVTPAKQIPEPNFDEAFGFTAKKSSSPFESVPAPQPPVAVSAPIASPAPVVAGVNAFDEAMSKISGTSGVPSILPQFSFDTSFDDNFDFSSVSGSSATTFSPAPSAVNGKSSDGGFNDAFGLPTVNAGTAISHVAPSPAPVSFNDAFGVNTSTAAPVRAASPPKEPAQRVSFEENAGGRPFLQTLKLDESHSPSPRSEITTVPNSPVAAKNGHPPSRRREARSLSPPLRSGTPPTQPSAPLSPRPSTSSGKEAPHDKHKDGGRSKLSVGL